MRILIAIVGLFVALPGVALGFDIINISNSGNADVPAISGSNVVWNYYDGSDWEIYLWDGATITNISNNNSLNEDEPDISGSNVVWRRLDGSSLDVYMTTILDPEVPSISLVGRALLVALMLGIAGCWFPRCPLFYHQ